MAPTGTAGRTKRIISKERFRKKAITAMNRREHYVREGNPRFHYHTGERELKRAFFDKLKIPRANRELFSRVMGVFDNRGVMYDAVYKYAKKYGVEKTARQLEYVNKESHALLDSSREVMNKIAGKASRWGNYEKYFEIGDMFANPLVMFIEHTRVPLEVLKNPAEKIEYYKEEIKENEAELKAGGLSEKEKRNLRADTKDFVNLIALGRLALAKSKTKGK